MEGRKRPRTRLLMAPGLLRTPVVLGSRVYLHTRRIVLRPVLTTYTQLLWEENSAARSQACFEMFSPPPSFTSFVTTISKGRTAFYLFRFSDFILNYVFHKTQNSFKDSKKGQTIFIQLFLFFLTMISK